ncbi:DUF1365 domain-containing protein [Pinisolibacter aquiterrae]|uniref:DUF1365 domain-containing protein n=1 Tax=Pinisolibacter aquiterrae TaxID=2815579 RepID=UPI001C3C6D59|nr:DUF1365 family protein [Pinisolibacter aquiterrae]MBV5263852.1 DUF1365 family protein [Pinisolibacter aquiterrae]MCC8237245.1 DUF1365 family protein [Pinisolibacter aquiterrae]
MTPPFASALYPGHVIHHRLRPREHRLAYRVWSMLLDLDELPELDRRLRFFSVDRFNLVSFHARDRGDGTGRDLRAQVESAMRRAGIDPDGGPIRLFTMPRLLGWSFNPLSIFFCHARDGRLAAILWEVDNTFGERHGYLIPVEETDGGEIRQRCDKALHVSPFMDMDQSYAFRVKPPAEFFSLVIDVHDAEGRILGARHLARREELTDRALLRLFFAVPFLTLRVVGGIHWEALKLWLKGVKLRFKPPPPETAITIVSPRKPRKAAS